MTRWEARGRAILGSECPPPRIMGILNVSPDSFSNGGQSLSAEAAAEEAFRLVEQGAHLIDLGGESTRPGSFAVPLETELERVLPVVERLDGSLKVPLSIDTSKAAVARAALQRGAAIINDITALRGDHAMAEVVAEFEAGIVLMHMRGTPATMQQAPNYTDVVAEVIAFLEERIAWCEARGIARGRIAVDPGIGFGKTIKHNLDLLRGLDRFANLGCGVVVGTSRKGFLGTLTGQDVSNREVASAVSSLAACVSGAHVVRVHDVKVMADSLAVWSAQRGWEFRS